MAALCNRNDDPERCAYKKEKTGEFNNENDISFDHDMMSVRNPIKLTIDIWPVSVCFHCNEQNTRLYQLTT